MRNLIILFSFLFESITADCNSPLGMKSHEIKDGSISASSHELYFDAKYGRLDQPYNPSGRSFGGWCSLESDPNQYPWLQIDLGKMKTVKAIATQGTPTFHRFVKEYILKYSYDGRNWETYRKGQVVMRLQGNKNRYDTERVTLNPPVTARYIRVQPVEWNDRACMRVELYGCVPDYAKDDENPTGVSSTLRLIPNGSMTASTEYNRHFAYEGRLNNTHRLNPSSGERNWGAWCAQEGDSNPYLQIDLGRVRVLSAVATQGYILNLWTTEYRLNYSLDGVNWKQYMERGMVKLFSGNSDNNTIRTHRLTEKVTARYVRFNPVKWNGFTSGSNMPCLRIEVYERLPIKGTVPVISPIISDRHVRRGDTFNLTCGIQGQPGSEVAWLQDGKPLSTSAYMSIMSSEKQGVKYSTLKFIRTKMGDNGRIYSCAAWYPLTNVKAMSSAVITVTGPKPTAFVTALTKNMVMIKLSTEGPSANDINYYQVRLVSSPFGNPIRRKYSYNHNLAPVAIRNLNPYTKYELSVRFIYTGNDYGTRVNFNSFITEQDSPSGPPIDVKISDVTSSTMKVRWQPPSPSVRNGKITKYQVHFTGLGDTTIRQSREMTTNQTNARLTGLLPNTRYDVTVRAFTIVGPGPYSKAVDAFTKQAPPVPSTTPAPTKKPIQITEELTKINKVEITADNALNITEQVQNCTNMPDKLNSFDVSMTADILEKVVKANGTNREIGQSLVASISNVLSAKSSVLDKSSQANNTGQRFVKILESWLENVDAKENDIREKTENLVVQKIAVVKTKFQIPINFVEKESGASITVPKEVFQKAKTKNGTNTSESQESIYFVYYKNNNFFRKKSVITKHCIDGYTVEEKTVYTPVLASGIVGKKVSNLSAPVVLKFKKGNRKDIEKTACVFWDFKAAGGEGSWSTEGCKLHAIVNNSIICHCDHMTNFAAIMDVYAETSKACGDHGETLSYISVIGCFLSLIGLFLTMLTYALFRRLRREIAAKVLIQLCFALFVVVILFLVGIERTDQPGLCLATAIILHYFTLVAFMWMFMEAAFMYRAFVRVWPPQETKDVMRCSFAAWGIPAVIVIATVATNLDNYKGQNYCRVRDVPFFVAFMAPICLIIAINMSIFGIIMYRLSSRPSSSAEPSNSNNTLLRLKRAFGIMILMGLTWVFGVAAISDARLVFQYLFAICNSLQGFAIFIFYCLSQKNARDAWIAFFKCDTRSENKVRTDSYYERRRLSSGASTKTNTLLVRTRTGSSTMHRNDSTKTNQEGSPMLSDQTQMQTIVEMDDVHVSSSQLNAEVHPRPRHLGRHSGDVSASSAEDEVKKVNSQDKLQPYSSYKTLSDVKALGDLLDIANTMKSSKSASRSNEALVRKSLHIAGSSPLIQRANNVRPAKSCENLSPPGKPSNIPVIDFSQLSRGPRSEGKGCNGDIVHSGCKAGSDDDLKQNTISTASSIGTLKDVETETETDVKRGLTLSSTEPDYNSTIKTAESRGTSAMLPPLKRDIIENFQTYGSDRSHEDIMRWLHDSADADDVPSDTSEEYRSSIYSSLNDVNSELYSCRSSVSSTRSSRRGKPNDSVLGRMIVGPLRGSLRGLEGQVDTSVTSYDDMVDQGVVNHVYSSSLARSDAPTIKSSMLYRSTESFGSDEISDEGYSASGEGTLGNDIDSERRTRRPSRTRHGSLIGNGKPKFNGKTVTVRSAYV